MYRVLGGRRPTPCSGTRDDGATGTDACRTPDNCWKSVEVRELPRIAPLTNVEGSIVASVNIKPLEDKILVQANEAETTTASGLVIPDTAKEKPQEGTVVAVGPGRWDEDGEKRIPLDVAEGDTVIYSKYGGTEIKYEGEEYLILSARDVLAVVNK
jgi:chaperonin GroES